MKEENISKLAKMRMKMPEREKKSLTLRHNFNWKEPEREEGEQAWQVCVWADICLSSKQITAIA